MTPHHMPSLRKLQESVLHLHMETRIQQRRKLKGSSMCRCSVGLPSNQLTLGLQDRGVQQRCLQKEKKKMDSNTNRCAYIENILDFQNSSRRSETQFPGNEVNN